MIQPYTRLKVSDNSGAKIIGCIRVIGGAKANAAKIGDIIIGAVKSALPRGQVKTHEVVRAVIVRQKFPLQRTDGSTIRFDDNAVVIIDANNEPRGTRILGPVARELREKGFAKIVSLAPEVV